MTHKEFYIWLEGYLCGRLEDEHTPITPIVQKMGEVKDNDPFFPNPRTVVPQLQPISVPTPKNPFDITFEKENFRND
jgi:hypothetical protein